mmetsp:Transcript_52078/g.111479  ORF Transcript_52078/g.111479 Transcript_52078/m.111479 type:complete len:230 (+) Transcript_52078:315-1004(+)
MSRAAALCSSRCGGRGARGGGDRNWSLVPLVVEALALLSELGSLLLLPLGQGRLRRELLRRELLRILRLNSLRGLLAVCRSQASGRGSSRLALVDNLDIVIVVCVLDDHVAVVVDDRTTFEGRIYNRAGCRSGAWTLAAIVRLGGPCQVLGGCGRPNGRLLHRRLLLPHAPPATHASGAAAAMCNNCPPTQVTRYNRKESKGERHTPPYPAARDPLAGSLPQRRKPPCT